MSNSTAQGLYSPLPQSISDTDSEEELHNAIPIHSRKLNEKQTVINGYMKDYHHLDDVEDGHINGFPNINNHNLDDIPIIKDSCKKPMSTLRKFFFILSICVCFLTIIVFLWVLPCSLDATCPAVQTHRSSNSYHGFELMGPITIVNGVPGHSKNLVFLVRGDVSNAHPVVESPEIPASGGGAISFIGDSGEIAWVVPTQRLPTIIDCDLIDVTGDGEKDCLITGEKGLFTAIHPISGQVLWHVHIHDKNNSLVTSIDFPLIINDVDNDNINDFLTTCSVQNGKHNTLVVISGRMGSVIGKPYTISDCDVVHDLHFERSSGLSYTCKTSTLQKKSYVSMMDIYYKSVNKTYVKYNVRDIKQHIPWKIEDNFTNYVNGHKLIVNNQGSCPGNCSVSVQLINSKSGKDNVAWSCNGTNEYGMVPTKLSFKTTQSNLNLLQGHVNGYILKFWQWNDIKRNKQYENSNYVPNDHHRHNIHDDIVKTKLRDRRSLPLDKTYKNLTEQYLTERVVLITFNSTAFKIVNASQNDIRQLCLHNGERLSCQPDLALQENSVLLADIDNDGSQELISYLTTFIDVNNNNNIEKNNPKYQLESRINVIRLEKELPQLYESPTKY